MQVALPIVLAERVRLLEEAIETLRVPPTPDQTPLATAAGYGAKVADMADILAKKASALDP